MNAILAALSEKIMISYHIYTVSGQTKRLTCKRKFARDVQ